MKRKIYDKLPEWSRIILILALIVSGFARAGGVSLSAKERIFVVNADRRSIPVEQVYDSEGNSLMGTSIENGQTLTITAVFTLTDGFTPAAFRYVYDIMGFRRLQAEL